MERVWEELKAIEAQAQQIKMDAEEKAKVIVQNAKRDAEKLLSNTAQYADEESRKLYDNVILEANNIREAQLRENREAADKLKIQAQQNMDKAVAAVVKSVLED